MEKVVSNPNFSCPPEILNQQIQLSVPYHGFDDQKHEGLIEIHEDLAQDIREFFSLAISLKFPIYRILPASHPEFVWDDEKLMAANITSGFNYRLVAGTDEVSRHSYGRAFDVNPRQNPYIRYENGQEIVAPAGAIWDVDQPGTLHKEHPLVRLMLEKSWIWGGLWTKADGKTDYHHFELSLD